MQSAPNGDSVPPSVPGAELLGCNDDATPPLEPVPPWVDVDVVLACDVPATEPLLLAPWLLPTLDPPLTVPLVPALLPLEGDAATRHTPPTQRSPSAQPAAPSHVLRQAPATQRCDPVQVSPPQPSSLPGWGPTHAPWSHAAARTTTGVQIRAGNNV